MNVQLFLLKSASALGIAFTSCLGLAFPSWLVCACSRADQDGINAGAVPRATSLILSCGNALSAGLLLAMGMMHFFSESVAADVIKTVQNSAPHAEATSVDAAVSVVQSSSLCLCAGIVVLLAIQHAVPWNRMHPEGAHSHAASDEPLDEEQQETEQQLSLRAVIVLAVLLSVHSVVEGIVLGIERAPSTLLSATLPMLLHKFFDGMIIGMRIAKTVDLHSSRGEPAAFCASARIACGAVRKNMTSVAWSMVTPVTLLVAASGFDLLSRSLMESSWLQSFAAGSFIYIATVDIIPSEFNNVRSPLSPRMKVLFLCCGIIFVAVVESFH